MLRIAQMLSRPFEQNDVGIVGIHGRVDLRSRDAQLRTEGGVGGSRALIQGQPQQHHQILRLEAAAAPSAPVRPIESPQPGPGAGVLMIRVSVQGGLQVFSPPPSRSRCSPCWLWVR